MKWPVGMGGKGNEGVAGTIRQLPGSIGYIELIYALQNKIPYGSVQNSSKNFIKASLESTTAAAAGREDAGRLPRVDHQSSGQERLSDRQLHLAADSHTIPRTPTRARS